VITVSLAVVGFFVEDRFKFSGGEKFSCDDMPGSNE
jgi:hypothetical protein